MTDRDDPVTPNDAQPPSDGESTVADAASIAPLRGRPVLPRALDTRSIDRAEQRIETQGEDAAVDRDEGGCPSDAAGDPDAALPESEPAGTDAADAAESSAEAADAADAADAASVRTAQPRADGIAEAEGIVPDATDPLPIEAEDAEDEPSSLESPTPLAAPAENRRRFIGRGAIAVGARALIGVVGVAVAAAVIAGATVLPAPLYAIDPPKTLVSPVAAAQQRVCPGPLLRLGDDQGQGATIATSVGRATSEFQATPRDAEAQALAETENTAGVAPQLLTLPPGPQADDGSTALAGSQSQAIDSGDLVGFAAAECAEPRGDTWLVGGSTDVGRTTLITLSNPTTVLATVDLAIYGTAGEVVAPGIEGIVVPPGSQRIFSLAGFAPQLVSPVVRVVSRGGLVAANLQQTTVRTLDPGGVDIVGATQPPSREVAIPGLIVGDSDAIIDAQGDAGATDLQTTLRIFTPGDDDSTVSVTITPARGNNGPSVDDGVAIEGAVPGVTPGSATFELDLAGGQVTEVPVPGLSDGEYSVVFEADTPIVAGARVSTLAADGATDFAWLPADAGLGDDALVSVAEGPSPVLRMFNPTDQAQEVTVSVGDADTVVTLEAGEAVPTRVRAGEDIRLSGAAGLLATVTYTGPGQLAAFGVTSPGPASSDLTVYR